MRRNIHKIISLTIIVSAVIFFINVLVDNPYFHGFTRAIINDKVKNNTNVNIEFQALQIQAFPLGVDLFGFKITPRQKPEHTIVESAHIKVRVSIPSLLFGTPKLSLVEANELKFTYPIPGESEIILFKEEDDQRKKEESPDYLWPLMDNLPIKRLVLMNSSLQFRVPAQEKNEPDDYVIAANGLNVDLEFDGWDQISAILDIQSLSFMTWGQPIISSGNLIAELELRDDVISSDYFELTSHNFNFTSKIRTVLDLEQIKNGLIAKSSDKRRLKGIIVNSEMVVKNSDIEVLGNFLEIDDTKGKIEGEVSLDLRIPLTEGDDVEWSVKGKGRSSGAKLYEYKLLDSEVSFNVGSEKIEFTKIDVKQGKKSYGVGKGLIEFNDALSFDFSIALKDIPFNELMEALTISDFELLNAEVTSNKLQIQGEGFPFSLRVKTKADFNKFQLPVLQSEKGDYSHPPSCFFEIDLLADAELMHFNHVRGYCKPENMNISDAGYNRAFEEDTLLDRSLSYLQMNGWISFDKRKGLSLELDSPLLSGEFGSHFFQADVEGDLSFNSTIRGPFDDIIVDTNVRGDEIAVKGMVFDSVDGLVRYKDKEDALEVVDFVLKGHSGGVVSVPKAEIVLNEQLQSKISLAMKDIPSHFIAALPSAMELPYKIQFSVADFKADLEGPLLYPLAFNGKMAIDFRDGSFEEENLFSEVKGEIILQKDSIKIEDFQYGLGYLNMDIDFIHNRHKRFSYNTAKKAPSFWESQGFTDKDTFKLRVATVDDKGKKGPNLTKKQTKDYLGKLPFLGKVFENANIKSEIVLKLDIEGTYSEPQGGFEGVFRKPVVFGCELAPFSFSGFLNNKKVEIPVLSHAGKAMIGRVNIDFSKDEMPYDWYLNFHRLDLRAIGSELFYSDPRNYAYINANWKMEGDLIDFWHSSGEISIDDMRVYFVKDVESNLEKVRLHLERPAKIIIDNKGWNFSDEQGLRLLGKDMSLIFSTKGNRPPDKLGVNIDSVFKIAPLKKLFTVVETARGQVEMKGSLKGSIENPNLYMSIRDEKVSPFNINEWEPITIGFVDLPPAFENVKLDIEIKDHKIVINDISLNKGKEGKMNISGVWDIKNHDAKESNISMILDRIELKRMPAAVIRTLDSTLSGDISISGGGLPLKISGNINVDEGRSIGDFDIRRQIVESFQKRKFVAPTIVKDPMFDFHLKLISDNSITVRNRNLTAKAGADLLIRGNESNPILTGVIQAVEGKFSYKRDFAIKRGIITFDKQTNSADPRLDIIGEAKISSYTVQVFVTGFASAPKISLSVDPAVRSDGTPITKMDILILLSTGRLPKSDRSIANARSDTRNAEDAARNEALNLMIGQFEQPIEKLFDLTGQTVIREIYLMYMRMRRMENLSHEQICLLGLVTLLM